jgi:hypothetical protein
MAARIVQGTQGVNLLEKSRFYTVATSIEADKIVIGHIKL